MSAQIIPFPKAKIVRSEPVPIHSLEPGPAIGEVDDLVMGRADVGPEYQAPHNLA